MYQEPITKTRGRQSAKSAQMDETLAHAELPQHGQDTQNPMQAEPGVLSNMEPISPQYQQQTQQYQQHHLTQSFQMGSYQQQQQQQPQRQQQQEASFMPEKDVLYTILCELKRTAREYTTAITESNCPAVRQMFTDLLHSTLSMQGKLYNLMKQQNMYSASSQALRQEMGKQLQQHSKSEQETQQFVNQRLQPQSGFVGQPMGMPAYAYYQQPPYGQPHYM